ncbi:MAG: ABC transporter ATP-binding protein [Nanoarchaeota archaeon]|nr:ABC transporter ATP-binding protein [Nanoarchaeota archaeon]
MGDENIIVIDNLIKRFGKKLVLDRINLKIKKGEFFGIIGLSGSGKTTLLNILVGYWDQTIGKITYDNKDSRKYKKLIKQKFGFATQAGSVYPKLTVEENMHYFGTLFNMRKDDIKIRTSILLDLVELTGANKVLAGDLSTGMERRLDIACALIHNPLVLILDEPTEDLDPVLRKELLALLKKINDEGTTIIMTSHLLNDVEVVCDRLAILHNGYIIEVDSPNGLKNKYSKNEEIHLVTKPGKYADLVKKLDKKKFSEILVKKNKLVLYAPDAEKVLEGLLKTLNSQKEKIIDLKVNKPTLEEIFEAVTKR